MAVYSWLALCGLGIKHLAGTTGTNLKRQRDMSEDRLNRIEQKLDRLVDVVESIARVEEKQAANDSKLNRFEYRLDKMEEDVNDVGKIARQNSGVAKFADKFFWIVIGGLVSFTAWLIKSGVTG